MTCYTENTPFEQALKLLSKNGFNGVAETSGRNHRTSKCTLYKCSDKVALIT